MRVVSVIPARGESKGIIGKNKRLLAGKPLVAHTIMHSLESELVDETIVSTDDPEIKKIAKDLGATVVDRPDELCGDSASSESAIKHALERIGGCDVVVFLQCTSPIRADDDIDNMVKRLMDVHLDSLFSVYSSHYYVWDGIKLMNKERIPRQKMNQYTENGSIYVFRYDGFMKHKKRIFGKKDMYVMPQEHSFQIDSPFDFWLCEQIMKEGL